MKINKTIRNYFSALGKKGGKKSRRILTPEQARAMVKAREEKRKKKEFKEFMEKPIKKLAKHLLKIKLDNL